MNEKPLHQHTVPWFKAWAIFLVQFSSSWKHRGACGREKGLEGILIMKCN